MWRICGFRSRGDRDASAIGARQRHARWIWRGFREDSTGATAVIFAVMLVPLLTAVGVAIDYSRAASARAGLQAALDSAAIALAKDAAKLSTSALASRADQLVRATLNGASLSGLAVTANYSSSAGGSKLKLDGVGAVSATFTHLFGRNDIAIHSMAEVAWGNAKYEIALVIDNSSSMADAFGGRSKVDAAKEAAAALVDAIFDAAATPGQAKIAVVPYTSAVNIGAQYQTAGWVDTAGESSIHWQNITKPANATSRFTLFDWVNEPWGGCFETRPNGFGLTDDAPTVAKPDSLFVPMFAPDEPGAKLATRYSGSAVLNSYLNDDGQGACTGALPNAWSDRQKLGCKYNINRNASKVAYTTQWGIKTGPNFMCNAVQLLRLAPDRTTIKSKISGLRALGDTSIFEGVAWGWRTLSPNGPFADGRGYQGDPENQKILILLSDGNNNWLQLSNPNKSLYAAMGFYFNDRLASGISSQTAANGMLNAKTKQVCANAKAKGVAVYVVGVRLPSASPPASWQDLLTNCASTVDGVNQAYIATNGDQLVEIFKKLATNMTRLRITN